MNKDAKVPIHRLSTGVPGLDDVLGGGLPEYSFNLIAGNPGAGKTTLAQQILFANATVERSALYVTVLGEPPLKMLRYQQQFNFFRGDKVGKSVHFINLSEEVQNRAFATVLAAIAREVESRNASLVAIDSFRTIVRATGSDELALQDFVQQLALYLTSWQATTFLIGEYMEDELRVNPVFTIADGIIWQSHSVERSSIVRKLQIVKMRGQAAMPGFHTYRITDDGLEVFPRTPVSLHRESPTGDVSRGRTRFGVAGLDEMLSGGIPTGDSVLITGPTGTGKSVLATQFIAEGVEQGEGGVITIFEEHPKEYVSRVQRMGIDLEEMIRANKVRVLYLRPLDLSVDETLRAIGGLVHEIGARRLVIDSLSGFELALAPAYRVDFRESLYRMVGMLTGEGITVLMTVEVTESFAALTFSGHEISFLSDDIILQRYVEIEGQLLRVMTVVKMRGSQHSKDLRIYEISQGGISVGPLLKEYRGVLTGNPGRVEKTARTHVGLTETEVKVFDALSELGEAPLNALLRRVSFGRQTIQRALDRLVALDYALKAESGGQPTYRITARPL